MRSSGLFRMAFVATAVALVGCTTASPVGGASQSSPPSIDGLVLDEAISPDQLEATRLKFNCLAQDSAGRFELCVPKGSGAQASTLMLLDGHVGGFLRTFDQGLADTAEQWALSLMGLPTNRKVADGRVDLMWDDKEKPFARLLTHLQDFEGQSAFLVLTRDLDRFLDENPALLQTTSDQHTKPEGMTPGKCLAMPFLCPAA